ncbi:MAG: helix-turn-helix transcriptional regulator [Acidimicrobiales bacterium]
MTTTEPVTLRVPNYLVVGTAEIAVLLRVSRQRVDQLTRRPDFPLPVAELASGRFWVRGDVERWAIDGGRIGRSEMMSKFEYRLLPWKGLISSGGSSPYDSLHVHLNEQGVQGWRFDQRLILDYVTQQIEYGLFVKETEDKRCNFAITAMIAKIHSGPCAPAPLFWFRQD